jgi:hypothetical protein
VRTRRRPSSGLHVRQEGGRRGRIGEPSSILRSVVELNSARVGAAARKYQQGRSVLDEHGRLNSEIEHDRTSNFQGRYAILHPWTGGVTCAAPAFAGWGGPPDSSQGAAMAAQPATNLAFVLRGKLELCPCRCAAYRAPRRRARPLRGRRPRPARDTPAPSTSHEPGTARPGDRHWSDQRSVCGRSASPRVRASMIFSNASIRNSV